MKIKVKDLYDAINAFKYSHDYKDGIIDIELRTDSNSGSIGECVTISASYTRPPTQYQKSEVHVKQTIEVFPDSDNRKPRVYKEESSELT